MENHKAGRVAFEFLFSCFVSKNRSYGTQLDGFFRLCVSPRPKSVPLCCFAIYSPSDYPKTHLDHEVRSSLESAMRNHCQVTSMIEAMSGFLKSTSHIFLIVIVSWIDCVPTCRRRLLIKKALCRSHEVSRSCFLLEWIKLWAYAEKFPRETNTKKRPSEWWKEKVKRHRVRRVMLGDRIVKMATTPLLVRMFRRAVRDALRAQLRLFLVNLCLKVLLKPTALIWITFQNESLSLWEVYDETVPF